MELIFGILMIFHDVLLNVEQCKINNYSYKYSVVTWPNNNYCKSKNCIFPWKGGKVNAVFKIRICSIYEGSMQSFYTPSFYTLLMA